MRYLQKVSIWKLQFVQFRVFLGVLGALGESRFYEIDLAKSAKDAKESGALRKLRFPDFF